MQFSVLAAKHRVRNIRTILFCSYGTVLLGLTVPVFAKFWWEIPPEHFMRDGVSVMEAPAYVGLFSNLGILLWCSTAAICFFAAGLHPATGISSRYWRYSGLLTSILLADDLFLFHEIVLPQVLGFPETLVYALYGAGTATYLLCFRRTILKTDFILLALALGWFAASFSVDRFEIFMNLPGFYLIEDGFKLLGIVSWFLYFSRTAHQHLGALNVALRALDSGEATDAKGKPIRLAS